ncbi:MAG: hypothetical protein R3F59_26150 [Myxococcota bacterium]
MSLSDVTRQLATIAGGSSLLVLGPTSDFGGDADAYLSPAVPASPTFAIWGPLFLGNLATLALQTSLRERQDSVLKRIAWPLAVARGGTGLWSRVFALGHLPASLALIGTTWGAAALAYSRLPDPTVASARDRWLVSAPTGALFGWLTVAAVTAKTELLLDPRDEVVPGDVQPLGPAVGVDPTRLAVAAITGTGVLAAAVTAGADRTLAFPAAVAWGLGGIVARQADQRPVVAAAATGALLGLGAAAVIALARRRSARRVERARREVIDAIEA